MRECDISSKYVSHLMPNIWVDFMDKDTAAVRKCFSWDIYYKRKNSVLNILANINEEGHMRMKRRG
jgi:hypothetical protein